MRVSRTGELAYRDDNGSTRIEVVSPEELFRKDSYDSLKMKPITRGHPPVLVNADNAREYQRGMTGNIVTFDGDFLGIVGTITDRETIDAIKNGVREVSLGYTCDVVPRSDGKFDQRNRQYNHSAIVDRGRAGEQVRVHFDGCECWSQDDSPSDGGCKCEESKPSPTKKKKMETLPNATLEAPTLYQFDIQGHPVRVDADTYALLRKEEQKTNELQKRADSLQAKLDELERADGKGKKELPPEFLKNIKKPEEEEEAEEDEKMDAAALIRRLDSLEGENMGLRDRIALLESEAARTDAKAQMAESEDESEEEMEEAPEDEEDEKMDVADYVTTWEATRDRLLPEIKADRLTYDSLDSVTALKREYLRLTAKDTSRLDSGSDEYINARFDALMDGPAPLTAKDQLDRAAASIVRQDGMGCSTPPRKREMKPLTYGGGN